IDSRARDRWLELMDRALAEAQLPNDVDHTLRNFFQAVAAMRVNRPGCRDTAPPTGGRVLLSGRNPSLGDGRTGHSQHLPQRRGATIPCVPHADLAVALLLLE